MTPIPPPPRAVWAALSMAALAAVILHFSDPIFSFLSSRAAGTPVRLTGVRLLSPSVFFAEQALIRPPGHPPVKVQGVRVRGLCGYFFGGKLRVRFERAESVLGSAEGGLVWKDGRLVKAHAFVTLAPEGLSQIPAAWTRRFSRSPRGPGFFVGYAEGRVTVRGAGGPILEAAWRPS